MIDLPMTHVFTAEGSRKLVPATVRGLVESIKEIGIINPLRVRPARKFVLGVEADAYEVIAGGHRLAAALKLRLETVPCIVVDDDLHAELVMIDENLMRAELDLALRAKQTARRKEIYLKLHPETALGENQHTRVRHNGEPFSERFTANTAASIGKSERSIQRDAARGEKIAPEVLDKVAGTKLATGPYLDRLKKIDDPVKQTAKVERDLKREEEIRAEKRHAKTRHSLSDDEAVRRQFDRIMVAWKAACPKARKLFMAAVEAKA
jgi:ParB-like chromosome segregation protein Spo0J